MRQNLIADTYPSIEPPTTIANSESDSTEEAVFTDPPVSTPELGNIKEDKYYSIKYKQSLVQLRDDEKTVVHILGEPDEASQVKQLGDGADILLDFMKELTQETNKEIILTPESTIEEVYISVKPNETIKYNL